jgi:hypothetical protein
MGMEMDWDMTLRRYLGMHLVIVAIVDLGLGFEEVKRLGVRGKR